MRLISETRAWRLGLAHLVAGLILPPYSLRRLRAMLFRLGGVAIPPGVEVSGGVVFAHPNVVVGRGTFFAPGAQLVATDSARITIGSGVGIGPRSQIFTPTHEVGGPERRCGPWRAEPVTIHDGAWVGAGAVILAGVTVGPGAVVAAGAMVTADVPAHTFVAGVPARVLRSLPPDGPPA